VLPGFGQYFHTDQRSFSEDPTASARSSSSVMFSFNSSTSSLTQYLTNSYCGETIRYDATGKITGRKTATPDVSVEVDENSSKTLALSLSASATNPLLNDPLTKAIPLAMVTPAISYYMRLILREKFLMFTFRHDLFPAYEALLSVNNDKYVSLTRFFPPAGPMPALAGVALDSPTGGVFWFDKFPFQPIGSCIEATDAKRQLRVLLRNER
jgi:hypothetical protein